MKRRAYVYKSRLKRALAGITDRIGDTLRGSPRARSLRPPPSDVRRILAIKLDHLGDLVVAIPAIEALRKAYPRARLELLLAPSSAPLLQGLGLQSGGADSDSFGSTAKRTFELTDDQIGEMMDAMEARRGSATTDRPHADIMNYYEQALRIIGAYVDNQRAHDVFAESSS